MKNFISVTTLILIVLFGTAYVYIQQKQNTYQSNQVDRVIDTAEQPQTFFVNIEKGSVTEKSDTINNFFEDGGTSLAGLPAYLTALCQRNVSAQEAHGNFVATFTEMGVTEEDTSIILNDIFSGTDLKTSLNNLSYNDSYYMNMTMGLCR